MRISRTCRGRPSCVRHPSPQQSSETAPVIIGSGATSNFTSAASVPWAHVVEAIDAVALPDEVTVIGESLWAGLADGVVINGESVVRRKQNPFRFPTVLRLSFPAFQQFTLDLPSDLKREQETLPLRKSGDFFRKIVITEGYDQPLADNDGILHIGVIPFLLDRTILDEILRKA